MHPNGTIGMKTKTLIAALASGVAFVTCAASAQQSDPTWTTSCEPESCALSLGVTEAQTGRAIATALMAVSADEADPIRFGVALPLGLDIDAGVRIVVGEQMVELPFEVCFPDGCRAMRPLDEGETAAISGSESFDIRFFPFGSNRLVSVTVPSTGLATAIEDARRTLRGD